MLMLFKEPSLPLRSDHRNVQWVFLGCPGVGKGTYASKLSSLLDVPHIATGDLVRYELNSSSDPFASKLRLLTYKNEAAEASCINADGSASGVVHPTSCLKGL
ncbi:hypothetical protein ACFE04_021961 [Oxalis oulophora]